MVIDKTERKVANNKNLKININKISNYQNKETGWNSVQTNDR